MNNLSVDEISQIVGYTDVLPSTERVSSIFFDASIIQKENVRRYLNQRYPGWIDRRYNTVIVNQMALDGRFDLILYVVDAVNCDISPPISYV